MCVSERGTRFTGKADVGLCGNVAAGSPGLVAAGWKQAFGHLVAGLRPRLEGLASLPAGRRDDETARCTECKLLSH